MQGHIYGYARVSSKDQNEHRQIHDLVAFGVHPKDIFIEKVSGKDFNRPVYRQLFQNVIRKGDLLVVKSIDRLGRNYSEVLNEWRHITKTLGVDIRILDMPLLDTRQGNDLIGKLISDIVLELLSFVAESERDNIRQRQAEGIAAAKRRGVKFGRPKAELPSSFAEVYSQWRRKEITTMQAKSITDLSHDRFYNMVKRYEHDLRAAADSQR